jgi:hypothetical protein
MVALFVVALAAPPAVEPLPKPESGFGMPASTSMYLPKTVLEKKPFAAELKLTEEQGKKVKELHAKLNADIKDAHNRATGGKTLHDVFVDIAKDTDGAIAKLLTDGQARRHRQLVWQSFEASEGTLHLAANPVVAKAIGFGDDQNKQIAEWMKEWEAARQELRRDPAKVRDTTKGLGEKVLASLTTAQKVKWNELEGEPFQGPDVILQPGMRPLKFPGPKK